MTPPPAASPHLEVVTRRRAEAAQQTLACWVAAAVHLLRRQPEEGPRPGPAAVRVRQHLDLVQHPDLDGRREIRHLHGAGDVPRAVRGLALLARDELAGHAVRVEPAMDLPGQQAQRPAVDPGPRRREGREGRVGLAGVRRPAVQHLVGVRGFGAPLELSLALSRESLRACGAHHAPAAARTRRMNEAARPLHPHPSQRPKPRVSITSSTAVTLPIAPAMNCAKLFRKAIAPAADAA